MRYEIIEIFEEDYGCEGIPEGEELMCTVLIHDKNGFEKHIRLADSFLTKNQLKKGSTLLLEEV